jgi:general nucleoside transport system ATP-binding protein
MPFAIEARGIVKQFPGVLANDHVNFAVNRGEVHALLGENGAGKSTLMNVLYGLYRPDQGQIFIGDQPATFRDPNDAIAHGIGMVHQHFMLIPVFSVAENITLGIESVRKGWNFLGKLARLDTQGPAQRIREISHQYGLDVDPTARVRDLAVGAQQRVEIIKALYRHAEILILDEPTAVLTPQETIDLFRIIRSLTAEGVSIIFISHKLNEVLEIADRISVMHLGKMVGTVLPKDATQASLAEMMVGRKVILQVNKSAAHPGAEVLKIDDVHVKDDRGHSAVNGANLSVRAGEIVGVAGVQGNGQTELIEALTGLRQATSGQITLLNHDITHAHPREIIEAGVGHIPEDRQKFGLVLPYSLSDNLVLSTYYKPPFAHGLLLNEPAITQFADKLIGEFDIRTPSSALAADNLSGGNKQKAILARELSRPIKLLIAAQPTRGLDVGSIEFVHNRLVAARDQGVAVLLVSAELDEVLSLSDRVAVMFKGQIIAVLPIAEATRERVGLFMAGVTDSQEAAHA